MSTDRDGDDGRNGETGRNADHTEWLDALAAGAGYALVCPDGHGSLPPRRVCPACGSTSLSRESLSEAGVVETYSTIHVPSPGFADGAPYVTAIADFGPTRITGVLRGESDAVEIGLRVAVTVEERATDGKPLVVFRPVESR